MIPTGVSLIVTIVNKGYADTVMEAAREAGASGGTVLHARGTGTLEAEKIFGIAIEPEKDLLLILTGDEKRPDIMKAVYRETGLSTGGMGICFSLPVEDLLGTSIKLPQA
ncbi:MAG: P-II family nitrogen regulator [Clostridiales bacterium]|jgi:nitrogen regulatory protein PII|nr:P-II family nitrogen regulator [Clostridiales bacterium]